MHVRLAGSANQFMAVVSEESMECSLFERDKSCAAGRSRDGLTDHLLIILEEETPGMQWKFVCC